MEMVITLWGDIIFNTAALLLTIMFVLATAKLVTYLTRI